MNKCDLGLPGTKYRGAQRIPAFAVHRGLWETGGQVPAQGMSEQLSRNEWELARNREGVGNSRHREMKAGAKVAVMCVENEW